MSKNQKQIHQTFINPPHHAHTHTQKGCLCLYSADSVMSFFIPPTITPSIGNTSWFSVCVCKTFCLKHQSHKKNAVHSKKSKFLFYFSLHSLSKSRLAISTVIFYIYIYFKFNILSVYFLNWQIQFSISVIEY